MAPAEEDKYPLVDLPVTAGEHKFTFSLRRFLKFLGPGLLMSIAYVDPGNLEGDLQLGANAGYKLLWVLGWGTVLGYVVQMQAAKLGVVTGRNLAQHCRQQFSPGPRYLLWIMAEIAIIGSDIQEVIGSAIAILLLSRGAIPVWAGVLISAASSFLLLLIERIGQRALEGLFGIMIGTMVAAFAFMFSRAHVPSRDVAAGFLLPRLPRENIPQAVALLGSLIMPHNIYLHSALVQTRPINRHSDGHKREALRYFSIETALTLAVTVFINMFVVCVFAAGFYGRGIADIGLENAGQYLGETYGTAVVYIWALGLLSAGQSSTMTGTYTGQFVMGGFLNLRMSPWVRITITRLVALVPTLAVATISNSSTDLDVLNQLLNLLQSIQLPFALLPVIAFNASERVMGKFANSRALNALAGTMSLAVIGINLAGALAIGEEWLAGKGVALWLLAGCIGVTYLAFIVYVVWAVFGGIGSGAAGLGQPQGSLPNGGGTTEQEHPLLDTLLTEDGHAEVADGPPRLLVDSKAG